MIYFAIAYILILLAIFSLLVLERYCGLLGRLHHKLTGKSWYKD